MNDLFLGVDTSNYTTSAALCGADGTVIASLKAPLPVNEGERGLRQSDAVFAHLKNFPALAAQLREYTAGGTITAVGCSSAPRDGSDSYMPCFAAGRACAEMTAAAINVPVYTFSHQAGHIMAAIYSSRSDDLLDVGRRFGSFHVSGGTTDLMLVTSRGTSFDIECVGGCGDLHAGQLIDRTGVALGLKFPCGAEMEKLARENKAELPQIKTHVRELECSLSGVENLAAKLWNDTGDRRAVFAYIFNTIAKTLDKLTANFREAYGALPVVYAGGVMSNGIIKEKLSRFDDVRFAEPFYSTDNAAGTALLTRRKFLTAGSCNG